MKKLFEKYIIQISILFLLIGLVTIVVTLMFGPFNDWSFVIDPELSGLYGSFIGGVVGSIFSLVAALFIYQTLVTQQDTLKQQKDTSNNERFESTFFNLLSIQQEIRNKIKTYIFTLDDDSVVQRYNSDGLEFFAYSSVELAYLWKSITSEKYEGTYHSQSSEYIEHLLEGIADERSISYAIPGERDNVKSQLVDKEKLKYANLFYNVTAKEWKEAQAKDTNGKMKLIYKLFFQKYHYAIGHYYRHLYHIINFTDLHFQPNNESSKYLAKKYIDFIQAQMSSFEMMLLFYNSFDFPKLFNLLVKYDFFENLVTEDLIDESHNCLEGINLKSTRDFI